ncbi:hypothetical protein QBC38DRAFT_337821, partial [Podospora fimiseda]
SVRHSNMKALLTRLDTVTRRTNNNQHDAPQPMPSTPSTIHSSGSNTIPSRQTSVQSHTLTANTAATSWAPTVSPPLLPQQPQRQYWSHQLQSSPSSQITLEQRIALEESFKRKHADLTTRAAILLAEIQALKHLGSISQEEALRQDEEIIAFLRGIRYGKLSSSPLGQAPTTDELSGTPQKAQTPIRALARCVTESLKLYNRDAAYDLVIQDFKSLLPDGTYTDLPLEISTRASLLTSALPISPDPEKFVTESIMHFEHEILATQNPEYYANSQTFKAKAKVALIPRERFLSTSDNYAWDLQELVNEIVVKWKGKEWKNPVTDEFFSAQDIKRIREHPLGRGI